MAVFAATPSNPKILRRLFGPLVVLVMLPCASAQATEFVLSPAESYLTLSADDRGEIPSWILEAQDAGSLTAAFSGHMKLEQRGTSLFIADSLLRPIPRSGPYLPGNLPADYAGKAQLTSEHLGYLSVRGSNVHLWGEVLPGTVTPTPQNQFLIYRSQAVSLEIPTLVGSSIHQFNLAMNNLSLGAPSLTNVGGTTYRLEVPFSGKNTTNVNFLQMDIAFSGQLVAYANMLGGLTPEIDDGTLEWGHGWEYAASPGGRAETIPTGLVGADPAEHGGHVASLTPEGGAASTYQMLVNANELKPNTTYEVSFDVSAASVFALQDNSVQGQAYFSLGNINFANRVGGLYGSTFQTNTIDEWSRHTIVLNTAELTSGELTQALYLVFQATSANADSNSVLFDNVQITVVPEPATVHLLTLGVAGAALAARVRKQKRRGRSSVQSPKTGA